MGAMPETASPLSARPLPVRTSGLAACVRKSTNRQDAFGYVERRAVKTSTASPPRRQRVDGVEVDANFRARRRRETLILARLATAGVSLFLFLAMLCNCGRVTASGDAKADCYDTRVHERAARVSVCDAQSRWLEPRSWIGFCAIFPGPLLYT